MNKKQLMAGTLAALTIAGATMPAALAAQPDTAVPYAVMSTKSFEDAGLTLLSQEEGTTTAPQAEQTLQEQINAAPEGVETRITLQGDVSEDLTIPADKNIVLELAAGSKLTNVSGHTITNNGTLTIEGTGTVDCTTHAKGAVNNNGTLTIRGGTITRSVDVPKTNSWYVVNNAENATMVINGGEIIGNSTYSSCIRNLGKATVSGGTIRQDKMIAMKNDDTGTLTVTGGKIISEDQAIQNWKTAEIEGGEIEGNVYTWAYVEKGTEFAGETTISGGKVTGDVAAVNYDGGSAKPQVEVTGNAEITGELKTSNYDKGAYTTKKNDETAKITVSGGKFTTTPAEEYIDPSAEFDATSGTVSAIPAEQAVVSVGAKNYKTLAAAINAAQTGDTVVLKQDVTESVRVPAGKEITLDLAGKNIQSNDATSKNAVTVEGKLTVKDSTAATAPEVSGDAVTYVSGKITASNLGLYAIKGGEIVLESGSVESTRNIGVFVEGNKATTGNAVTSKITVKGGYILSQETAASAQGRGAELNIKGGVLKAKDNAVISGNGTKNADKDFGGTTINISDGTMIGGIQSAGYIACGVYHPQQGELNITGGKFQITNGVGVLIRAGSANITGGEIATTGKVSGWVGDKKIDEGCHGIVYDSASNYPGADAADKIIVGGGVKIVTDDGNSPVKMRRPEGSNENKIGVTGGSFSGPVEKEYLENLNAELNTGKGDAPYSYYTDVDAAKKVAKQLGYGTVTDLTSPSTNNFTVTLKFENGEADQTLSVAENGTVILPTPTRSGSYAFRYWTDGTNTYAAGSEYTVTKETTLTAVWRYTGSSSSSSSTVTPGALITISRPQHGSVTSSAGSSAIPGSNVMLTVTPDRGYELGSLSVRDSRGSELLLTNLGGGKYSFTMPAGSVQVDASFRKVTSASFVDVLPSSYYYDAVRWAVSNGITSGTSGITFSPNAACTRAQAVTFLWRAAGSPKPASNVNSFVDVPADAYYRDAVLWAVEQGITNGVSEGRFDPNATVTRGQTVAFLYRAAGRPSVSGSSVFHDVDAGAYYEDAVTWAYQKDITGGTSSSQFSPDAACTRAQIVTFLYRAQ